MQQPVGCNSCYLYSTVPRCRHPTCYFAKVVVEQSHIHEDVSEDAVRAAGFVDVEPSAEAAPMQFGGMHSCHGGLVYVVYME